MAAEKWIHLQLFSPFCQLGHNASFGWIYTDGDEAAGCFFALRLKASVTVAVAATGNAHTWTSDAEWKLRSEVEKKRKLPGIYRGYI